MPKQLNPKKRKVINKLIDIRCDLFFTHPNIETAFPVAMDLIETLHGASKIAAITAMMLMVNAIAKELEDEEDIPKQRRRGSH